MRQFLPIVAHFKGTGLSGFGYGSTAEAVTEGLDLSGQRILVTGCNSGIGLETMRVLAMRGATVLGAARTLEKARAACDAVQGDTAPLVCELSDPSSIRRCAEAVEGPLHAIIANAGIMALPRLEQILGYEKQFFTNHIGHFLLITELVDKLSETGRVVIVSSGAHERAPSAGIEFDNLSGERDYGDWKAYGQSKLANLLMARELGRRFENTGRASFAVHPGVIPTNLARNMATAPRLFFQLLTPIVLRPLLLKSVQQGAATQVWAAVHPDAEQHSGGYLADCNVAESTAPGRDAALATKLWDVSEEIVADWHNNSARPTA